MSTNATDAELCQRWKNEPAPLLPLLHAFHDRDQFISDAAIGEIAAIGPEFVISTGDLVVESNPATPEVAEGWLDLYWKITRATGIPFYDTIGNNELVGIWGSTRTTDPGYGKGLFRKKYGRTHYSFDRGRFHFAAVDTHRARPQRSGKPEWDFDRMEPEVAAWLDADLAAHADPSRRL